MSKMLSGLFWVIWHYQSFIVSQGQFSTLSGTTKPPVDGWLCLFSKRDFRSMGDKKLLGRDEALGSDLNQVYP